MKLTDICEFQGGSQPPKNEWSDEPRDGYIRMLQIRDYTQDNSKIEYIKVTNSTKMCEEKDILIARYGASIGKILTGLSGAYNVAMMKVIIDEKRVDRNYIYNFFKSNIFQRYIKNVGQRAAQAGFNKEELSKININIPNLDEQRKITQKIDKISEVITIRKEQINELDKLIKSQFVELFENNNEWNEVTLNDVSDKITDGEHGTVPRVESGKLYLMARNITESNKIDLTEISYIPEENHKKIYSRCNPEKGDLLLVCVGATVGKVALVPDMEEFSMARSVALIKPNKSLMNSLFLLYLMKSDYVQAQIKNCIHAAAQAGLYTNMVKNLKFRLPPNELQKKFAEFVEKVDKQKFEIQKSLEEMQLLQESLMDKYFGEM